jgi:hypothetical protein
MRPGDASPLLGAPRGPFAILFRDDGPGRAQTSAALEAALGNALGPRLAPPEARRLHAALDGWTKARGDWVSLGVRGADALVLRAPVHDVEALERSIKDGVELLKGPPFKDALRVDDVRWLGLRAAQISYGQKKRAELTWAIDDGRLNLTLGAAPGGAEGALGDDVAVRRALEALGQAITFAAVVQPLAQGPMRSQSGAAPLVLGYGTREGKIWAHADLADLLVRELVKARAGL